MSFNKIEVFGAREHNLKNLQVDIPANQLVVITGLSGSGKSSLAFDTIYAEGQRRYMETFAAYARQFMGHLYRPDVDKINGLSPVISIEQKTVGRNPRSTVGTVTEIYDFLRLLFARIGEPFSYNTGEKMVKFSNDQIVDYILETFQKRNVQVLAPLVKGRKGHYREVFERISRQGYTKVRVDGEIRDLFKPIRLDRYKIHDIELLIDVVEADDNNKTRLKSSVKTAFNVGKGQIMLLCDGQSQPLFYSKSMMCPTTGISYPDPEPNLFSFNSPYGACAVCKGLGYKKYIDEDKVVPDVNLSINKGGIAPLGEYKNNWAFRQIEIIGKKLGFTIKTPIKDIDKSALDILLYGSEESFEHVENSTGLNQYNEVRFEGIINLMKKDLKDHPQKSYNRWAQTFMNKETCPECVGTRLKKESLQFKICEKSIDEITNMDLRQLRDWFLNLEDKLNETHKTIAHEVIKEVKTRLKFLLDVGVDYLTLNRPARSLSGGEAQRIRLATQIGTQLVGVLYILDEPSIGLHQRDNQKLIKSLFELRDIGNSIIVVEHDKEMMESADHIIDIGPGAGIHGGKIVAEGKYEDVIKTASLTAKYLNGSLELPTPEKRRSGNGKHLVLKGCSGNNLKKIDLKIPLGTLICITGVSGSGKSTLIHETLFRILYLAYNKTGKKPQEHTSIKGTEHLDKVIEIDQAPIGRTPRSNPVTYTGVFTEIRNLYANMPESKIRGFKPGRFSFNVKGGRCETCHGAGVKTIEMNFLPDVYVECETCMGKRYNADTLMVRFKGKSISDVLNMTVEYAIEFFESIPFIKNKLQTLFDIGLGYIHLGQSSTTLSGGEAQRIKLASELSRKDTGNTLYILDEPTTGLHFEDIKVLMQAINRIVEKGNTVVIIEHNMDVIKMADHIVDLGPEGGNRGGQIVIQGTPEIVSKKGIGYTAQYLFKELTSVVPV